MTVISSCWSLSTRNCLIFNTNFSTVLISYKMFKFTNKPFGGDFLTVLKTFQIQKKWFYFFSGINTFLTKKLPRSPEIIKIPIKCLKSLIFSGETLKNIKKYLPQNLPQTSFRGYFLSFHFHFLKIWKSFLKNLKINYFSSR